MTEQLPKPLVPVFHRPILSYAFDHLIGVGAQCFVVNTHHLPHCYGEAFPSGSYRDCPLVFRNESPVILDTAGGLANARDLLDDGQPFIVYNGDILTDIALQPLLDEHAASGNLVTLALRSKGPSRNVVFDPTTRCVLDLRGTLGVVTDAPPCLFTGVYVVSPAFFDWLAPGKVESVVPVFLRMIQAGQRVGGVLTDDGHWWDLGDRASYLVAHAELQALGAAFPGQRAPALHPEAIIAADAVLAGLNVIGPAAIVGADCQLTDCILWPGARVAAGSRLTRCIVRSGIIAKGIAVGMDF